MKFSNTLLLETAYEWTGICIEPHPRAFTLLARNRRCTVANCAVGARAGKGSMTDGAMLSTLRAPESAQLPVEVMPLNEILTRLGAPRQIDFMSVDVEGFEDEALATFPFQDWRIDAMCIERPSANLSGHLLDVGFIHAGLIEGLDSFFVQRELGHVEPFQAHRWTRFQYRLEAVIRRLEYWGLLEDDSADWGQ